MAESYNSSAWEDYVLLTNNNVQRAYYNIERGRGNGNGLTCIIILQSITMMITTRFVRFDVVNAA